MVLPSICVDQGHQRVSLTSLHCKADPSQCSNTVAHMNQICRDAFRNALSLVEIWHPHLCQSPHVDVLVSSAGFPGLPIKRCGFSASDGVGGGELSILAPGHQDIARQRYVKRVSTAEAILQPAVRSSGEQTYLRP